MAVNIYEYLDYRKFLVDHYNEKKRTTKGMSMRTFCKTAGIPAWSYFKFVMEGKRNLKPATTKKFIKGLRLKTREADYFELLVTMNQSTDPDEKAQVYERVMVLRKMQRIHQVEDDIYRFLSKWYIAAVHELVAFADFDSDPHWIAQRLRPKISVADAKQALEVLVRLGLVVIDQTTGKTSYTKSSLTTPDEVAGAAVFNFQKEMLALANNALRFQSPKVREVSGVTVALSEEGIARVRKMLREFRQELGAKSAEEKDPKAVYQINFQMFPLSEVKS